MIPWGNQALPHCMQAFHLHGGSLDHEQMLSIFPFSGDPEGGLRGRTSFSMGGLAGEFGRGLIYWGLEKALEMGTFLHKGPVNNHGGSIHQELLRDS